MKAVKRINNENEDQANAVLVKNYYKRIEDLQSKLIYSDQWKFIFEELKKIQTELKDAAIRWNHKRTIFNQVNAIFDDLRKYRMTEIVSKTQGRIAQLTKILDGLKDSIKRDNESYQMQVEKMQHYTRGKLSVDELKSRFGDILSRTKEKETKAEGIKQTIAQLKADIEKEKKQQQEREELRIKREQEEAAKQEEMEAKRQAKKETKVISESEHESAETEIKSEEIVEAKDEVVVEDEVIETKAIEIEAENTPEVETVVNTETTTEQEATEEKTEE